MKTRTIVAGLAGAVVFGFAATLVAADDSILSFEVWVGASLTWFGVVVATILVRASVPGQRRARPIWSRSKPAKRRFYRPSSLAATDRVVAGSLRRPRLFQVQLRPRLQALVADSGRDPEQLGDLQRLVDPAPTDRTPTLEELHRLLDLVEDQR